MLPKISLWYARGRGPGVDQDWAAIHVIVFNLASVLLEPAISRQLADQFFSPGQLQRWNTATTELYRRGLTRTGPESESK